MKENLVGTLGKMQGIPINPDWHVYDYVKGNCTNHSEVKKNVFIYHEFTQKLGRGSIQMK